MRRARFALRVAGGLLAAWGVLPATAGTPGPRADVVAVRAGGEPGAFRFAVTVRSPDRDCDRYADWWEVVRPDGSLVYRRILMHSHAGEQPFTRSGGPVAVRPDETVIVRAHLHPEGYGGVSMRGSAAGGFTRWDAAPPEFAAALARSGPRPGKCWY